MIFRGVIYLTDIFHVAVRVMETLQSDNGNVHEKLTEK